jgi:hypothetical protein
MVLPLALLLADEDAFRQAISRHYPLPHRLIDAFADKLDFDSLSENEAVPWSEELLDAHARRWDWRSLAMNTALPWSEGLVRKYTPSRWSWDNLLWQRRIFASPGLVALCLPEWSKTARRHLDPDDNRDPGSYRYCQFTRWGEDAASWAPEVIEAAPGLHWDLWSAVEGFPWSAAFLARNAHRLDWRRLSWNARLPWSIELLRRFESRWSWDHMSANLPWSEELIAPFAHRWNWRLLAHWVPWTCALLDRFADRVVWAHAQYQDGGFERFDGVINHDGFCWTPAFYARHGARVARQFEELYDEIAERARAVVDTESPWTFHCQTNNWSPEMFALAEGLASKHGSPAIDWESACSHAKHVWSDDFIAAHRATLAAHVDSLSSNPAFPWHRELDAFAADIDPRAYTWRSISGNPGLVLEEALVSRYEARWGWQELSKNPTLTSAMIERYADRWDWWALSQNPALRPETAKRFAGRLHKSALTKQPWASLRDADPALPWDWKALADRAPPALREVLDDARVLAFLEAAGPRKKKRGGR